MTREQMEQLDEAEATAPFVTRVWPLEWQLPAGPEPVLSWHAVASAHAARITQLECEVAWLRHELEQRGEAK